MHFFTFDFRVSFFIRLQVQETSKNESSSRKPQSQMTSLIKKKDQKESCEKLFLFQNSFRIRWEKVESVCLNVLIEWMCYFFWHKNNKKNFDWTAWNLFWFLRNFFKCFLHFVLLLITQYCTGLHQENDLKLSSSSSFQRDIEIKYFSFHSYVDFFIEIFFSFCVNCGSCKGWGMYSERSENWRNFLFKFKKFL